jgi:uncharacterized membrane protein YjjP (DUF1212 family)
MLQEHDDDVDDVDEIERWCHGVWLVHVVASFASLFFSPYISNIFLLFIFFFLKKLYIF